MANVIGSSSLGWLGHHRAHLHRPGGGARRRRCPFERGVEIGDIDDDVAAELFLGVGKATVLDLPGAIGDAQHGGGRGGIRPLPPIKTPAALIAPI